MKNSRVIFLTVPENFQSRLGDSGGSFKINPDIPIPVEIPENGEDFTLENLSIEMILSGMLRVIEEGEVNREWIEYYCAFVIFLRPEILSEINQSRSGGLDNENYKTANDLIREGKEEEALSYIRNFIEIYPTVWNGWFLLGWALRLLGRWADGEAAFRKTIELGGDNSDSRNELAICLIEKGDITGAKSELEAALQLDPENEKILSNFQVVEEILRKNKAKTN